MRIRAGIMYCVTSRTYSVASPKVSNQGNIGDAARHCRESNSRRAISPLRGVSYVARQRVLAKAQRNSMLSKRLFLTRFDRHVHNRSGDVLPSKSREEQAVCDCHPGPGNPKDKSKSASSGGYEKWSVNKSKKVCVARSK